MRNFIQSILILVVLFIVSFVYYYAYTVQAFPYTNAINYTVGDWPAKISSADFNDDGYVDLVVGNNGSNNFSILINNGYGTFATAVNYPVGFNIFNISSADFNDDNYPDVVVPSYDGSGFSIFFNNGDGTFGSATNYSVGVFPTSVSPADLNGDGHMDLVIGYNEGASFEVFIGNGDGTFATVVSYDVELLTQGIFIKDFNGDNYLDLVIPNFHSISTFLNNGDGTFATGVNYPVAGSTSMSFASFADFDGDDDIDFVVDNANEGQILIFLNNGDGTFAEPVPYVAGGDIEDVYTADFNGDGHQDIAAAAYNDNHLLIFLNNGDGTFATAISYDTESGPQNITISDFNMDSHPDVVISNTLSNSVSVFLSPYAATNIKVETISDGSGVVVPIQELTSDGSITVYAISRNGDGDFVANISPDVWSLENKTGGVVDADLVPSGDGKSATLTGKLAGSATIKATKGPLAITESGVITISVPNTTIRRNNGNILSNGGLSNTINNFIDANRNVVVVTNNFFSLIDVGGEGDGVMIEEPTNTQVIVGVETKIEDINNTKTLSELKLLEKDYKELFLKSLAFRVVDEDVKILQQFLNSQGFIVSDSGPGSKGSETEKFGFKTKAALIKFQKVNKITPAIGYLGPKTIAFIESLSVETVQ